MVVLNVPGDAPVAVPGLDGVELPLDELWADVDRLERETDAPE